MALALRVAVLARGQRRVWAQLLGSQRSGVRWCYSPLLGVHRARGQPDVLGVVLADCIGPYRAGAQWPDGITVSAQGREGSTVGAQGSPEAQGKAVSDREAWRLSAVAWRGLVQLRGPQWLVPLLRSAAATQWTVVAMWYQVPVSRWPVVAVRQ